MEPHLAKHLLSSALFFCFSLLTFYIYYNINFIESQNSSIQVPPKLGCSAIFIVLINFTILLPSLTKAAVGLFFEVNTTFTAARRLVVILDRIGNFGPIVVGEIISTTVRFSKIIPFSFFRPPIGPTIMHSFPNIFWVRLFGDKKHITVISLVLIYIPFKFLLIAFLAEPFMVSFHYTTLLT